LTGGIAHFVLPSGTGNWLALFGLGRRDYGKIHFYLGVAVVLLLALHLAMHWPWLCGFVAKRLGKELPSKRGRLLAGAGTVAVVGLLLVGGLSGASTLVEERSGQGYRPRGAAFRPATQPDEEVCPAAGAINGRTSIEDAAVAAGLALPEFVRVLGIPQPVDPQEPLGRLKRRFGFSMQEVRRLVCHQR
jgi:hypothetical protein